MLNGKNNSRVISKNIAYLKVKHVEEEISLAILENGRTCQFRTVAAA